MNLICVILHLQVVLDDATSKDEQSKLGAVKRVAAARAGASLNLKFLSKRVDKEMRALLLLFLASLNIPQTPQPERGGRGRPGPEQAWAGG